MPNTPPNRSDPFRRVTCVRKMGAVCLHVPAGMPELLRRSAMANDYEDDLSRTEPPIRQARDLSSNYLMALAVWLGPSIVVGMLLFALNVSSYDTILSSGDEFMQTEQRRICG